MLEAERKSTHPTIGEVAEAVRTYPDLNDALDAILERRPVPHVKAVGTSYAVLTTQGLTPGQALMHLATLRVAGTTPANKESSSN